MDIESISKVNVSKGDVIIISTKEILDGEAINNINYTIKAKFPDNEVVVLDGGLKLDVLELQKYIKGHNMRRTPQANPFYKDSEESGGGNGI